MTHAFSYEDRRIVVTGAASGVGAALLDVIAELDAAHVTVLDLAEPSGPHDTYLAVNLSEEDAVRGAIAQRSELRILKPQRYALAAFEQKKKGGFRFQVNLSVIAGRGQFPIALQ